MQYNKPRRRDQICLDLEKMNGSFFFESYGKCNL